MMFECLCLSTNDSCSACITQTYLTEEDFQKVFKITVSEFKALAEWKRINLKKKVDLF